jgi:hypothetical protein
MDDLYRFGHAYQPELLIQAAVLVTCWVAALLFDLLGPQNMPDLDTRRWVLVICVPVGFFVSMMLWANITDPDHDKTAVRVLISLLGACLGGLGAPYFNRWIIRFIAWKWPGLGASSAFKP